MVHPREGVEGVEGLKSPDSVVRSGPSDPGTVAEFKTLDRAVGLAEEDARRGYARAAGQAKAHGSDLPERVRVILGDGTIIEFP